MPAPSEVIDAVLERAAEEEAEAQNRLARLIALHWFSFGGVDDAAATEWTEMARPVLGASRAASAERGWTTTSLHYSLSTDSNLDPFDDGLFDTPSFRALEDRAETHLDAPVVRARYELSERADAVMRMEPPSVIVQEAREQARQMGLYTVEPSAEVNRYAAAMDRGAARAVEQALGDSDRAYGAGAQRAATGKRVKRWLKVPNPRACEICVLVSRRGYRTAETAKLAGHSGCRCAAAAEWVKTTGHGSRERVSNVDWAEALEQRGFGLFDRFFDADERGRMAILAELFPNGL